MTNISWIEMKDAPVRSRAHGTKIWDLWQGEKGAKALIVKIEAGGKFADIDVHEPGSEEVYVVEGVFNDGVRNYPAGTFIHNPKGSSHLPQSETGCTLFVFYPEG
jgi:anti-sigma factor ChrR (cupin superfamily)